ncbi:hypothetical protein BgiMline_012816 [Biomphalaria glabrata]|nr:hypothetical protein BgiMline_016654 [Biomphalaria glabrata]
MMQSLPFCHTHLVLTLHNRVELMMSKVKSSNQRCGHNLIRVIQGLSTARQHFIRSMDQQQGNTLSEVWINNKATLYQKHGSTTRQHLIRSMDQQQGNTLSEVWINNKATLDQKHGSTTRQHLIRSMDQQQGNT